MNARADYSCNARGKRSGLTVRTRSREPAGAGCAGAMEGNRFSSVECTPHEISFVARHGCLRSSEEYGEIRPNILAESQRWSAQQLFELTRVRDNARRDSGAERCSQSRDMQGHVGVHRTAFLVCQLH